MDDRKLDRYLLSYAAIFDRVILQSSAFFKRPDLYVLLQVSPNLFRNLYGDLSLISLYRGVGEESNRQYIERRCNILSNGSIYNPEYMAYKKNDDILKMAKRLDKEFPYKRTPKAMKSTDQVFRDVVASLEGNQILSNLPNSKVIYDIMRKNAKSKEVFQTFFVLEKIQNRAGLNSRGTNLVGHQLRHCYFEANAIANSCLSIDNFHTNYKYVRKYLMITGLNQIVDSPITSNSSYPLISVRVNDCYRKLQELYFCLSDQAIDELYQLYIKYSNKPFYQGKEFERFCRKQAIEYDSHKKAFAEMCGICNKFRRGDINW